MKSTETQSGRNSDNGWRTGASNASDADAAATGTADAGLMAGTSTFTSAGYFRTRRAIDAENAGRRALPGRFVAGTGAIRRLADTDDADDADDANAARY